MSSAVNFSLYGNGGMNTTYGSVASKCGIGAPGVFCGGPAGVDLIQAFASISYARRDGNIRWGIAPTLAIQAFEAKGLGAFSGASSNSAALTDNGYDFSFGGGIRGGIVIDITDQLRFGVSGQSKMWMTRLDKYAGLFEGAGSFDILASVTAGFAYDATPDLTFMADYRHIFYSGVKAISNPFKPAPLGSPDGPGFGWDDVHSLKFGVEWRKSEKMTWRAGYAVASNPVGSDDVTLGILAPGIVEHHLTGGGAYKLNETDSIDFALVYAFSNSVNGIEVTPGGPVPGSNIELEMHQFSATIGWKRSY